VSPEEFTDFYAASFRRLVGQLYLMTGDQAEAQDAVQEAFVRAWAHRGKLDRLGAPEAWVRATAWHVAVSRWHRARLGRLLTRSQPRPPAVDGPSPDRVAGARRRTGGGQCLTSMRNSGGSPGRPPGTRGHWRRLRSSGGATGDGGAAWCATR
jgi:hypothetical protein